MDQRWMALCWISILSWHAFALIFHFIFIEKWWIELENKYKLSHCKWGVVIRRIVLFAQNWTWLSSLLFNFTHFKWVLVFDFLCLGHRFIKLTLIVDILQSLLIEWLDCVKLVSSLFLYGSHPWVLHLFIFFLVEFFSFIVLKVLIVVLIHFIFIINLGHWNYVILLFVKFVNLFHESFFQFNRIA